MFSVTCKINDKKTPEKWIEVEIGVEEGSGNKYWRLTAKSPVAFHNFSATKGKWDWGNYFGPDDSFASALFILPPKPDPFNGFQLFRTGRNFYRLACGQSIEGIGTREKHLDVEFRMDFLCV